MGFRPLMTDVWQRKYEWRVTWPGEGHEDWSGYDGSIYIGRVMRDLTTHPHKNEFMWSGGGHGKDGFKRRIITPHRGWEPEHWQAAKAVEVWYDRMREANGLPPRL